MKNHQDKRCCVIATSAAWNKNMVERLGAQTGRDFLLINARADLTADKLFVINPEFIFFPHWSYRIDSNIYEQFECVIFHMTDLPFGRGGSPLQNLIARGIYETKICAIRCVEKMDAGPIYLKKPLSLYGSAEEIFIRASYIIEDMIVEMLDRLPEPLPQKGDVTEFKRRIPDEGNLVDAKSLEQIFDLIRMLDAEGYPNAFLHIGSFKFEFSRASRKTDQILADVRISLVDIADKEFNK